jgi:quinoprotein dehydrogenase-associated probable ABC transporter substrate-binding protein
MSFRVLLSAAFALAVSTSLPARGLAQTAPDLVSHTDLRVCADPSDLPYSNTKSEGFENKIAELLARELNEKLEYYYFPDSQGFIRATLGRNKCDVIIGTVAGSGDVATTDAYYHTAYMMATRTSDNLAMDKVSDWRIAGKRFGLIAGTPPTDLIVEHNLMDQTGIYQLMVDTRINQPSHDMINDLVAGKIDVALLWGPIVGYYTKRDHLPLRVVFLDPDGSKVRLDYHIAMGIRPSDTAFRRRLNAIIAKDQPQITKILQDYGVPLLDEQNRPIPAPQ